MINAELIQKLDEHEKTHKLLRYEAYDYQKKFHHAHGEGDFVPVPSDSKREGLSIHRALMCANQIGKTFCGGMEAAMHLTGIYPDWWQGHRYKHPVTFLCASTTNETTRDRCQAELLGEPTNPDMLGTGSIPKDCIGKRTRKAGVPDAYEIVSVKHISGGWSRCYFKCYEQGAKKFMGYRLDGAWCDEEPPQDIWAQILRGLLATNGMAYITFTPEEGVTEVVNSFMNELAPGQSLTQATWDDAPHMTPDTIEQKLKSLSPHEREMRSKGVPLMGSGLIFPIPDEDIMCDPFQIPNHYAQIIGVDFGWDHPFAAVKIAHDRENDKFYVTDCFREKNLLIPIAADRVRRMGGDRIPVVWPHDGMQHDKNSGKPLAELFREHHLMMHIDPFTNPPQPGQKEGQGGQGVEVGLLDMYTAMEEGRFKVFSTLHDWFEEKRIYHRKVINNRVDIVKKRDDLMSATRYAKMMIRHAITMLPMNIKRTTHSTGLRNW